MKRKICGVFAVTLFLSFNGALDVATWADDTSPTAPSAQGPTTSAEASVLFSEGKSSFERKDFQSATTQLTRFVERYPAHPGYIEAHLLLGRALLELNRPKDALKPLQYYVQANRNVNDATFARLFLCEAYLRLHDHHEAFLLAEEIQKISENHSLEPAIQAEGLLYKAQAALALKQIARAQAATDAAKRLTVQPGFSIDAKAHTGWLDLQLRLQSCALLPSHGLLEEDTVRNQLDRRGACLNEATLIYRGMLQALSEHWSELGTLALADGFKAYEQSCENPPSPPELRHPKRRTALQLSQYRRELVDRLTKDCGAHRTASISLLTESPSPYSDRVLQVLKKGAMR